METRSVSSMRRGISSWPAVTKTVAQQTRAVTDPTLAMIAARTEHGGCHLIGSASFSRV